MPNRVQYLAPDIAVHFLKQKLLVEESQVPPALVFIGHPGGEPVQPIVPGKILHLTGWLTTALPSHCQLECATLAQLEYFRFETV